ncbi:hypothetical protein [Streptomyces sp. CRN 30]|uniref:hypothetical protein n=1 Tax=Streptomyces sp. CRN 30 TaxID=3075613 RepID=UPI002A8174ED|nr:hypothetical protein [Streptomyces sp. CRN 30]
MTEEPHQSFHAPFLDWIGDSPRTAGLSDLIRLLGSDSVYFIGGAVRDYLLGSPTDAVRDVDLLYDGRIDRVRHLLERRHEVTRTRFGNPSVRLGEHLYVDVFPPATPFGEPVPLPEAPLYCDTTVNAIALNAAHGRVLDPTGGLRDLRGRRTRLLPLGWAADATTQAHLLAKVVTLSRRHNLSYVDLHIADSAADRLRASSFDDEVSRHVQTYTDWRDGACVEAP